MQQTWGKVTADGDAAFIALIGQALVEAKNGVPLPAPYEELLAHNFKISAHTPAEMIASGAIIPGTKDAQHPKGIAAYGYVFDFDDLWLNLRIVTHRPNLARHISRHECAHVIPTSKDMQNDMLPLMWRENGSHPTRWKVGKYENRPEESRADTLAEAVSGIDSPWDDFHYYGLDVHEADFPAFVAIQVRAPTTPIEPPQEPLPTPLPDPQLLILQARLDAKDAKATELIAL